MKQKNVCMFVWNHFTNDARVLRECTALSENGYSVDLICIHDPSDKTMKRYEERNEHFRVHRVKRYPSTLLLLRKAINFTKTRKWPAIFPLLLLGFGFYEFPIITFGLAAFLAITLFALLKLKLASWWIKANIYLRMVIKGYSKNYDIYHSNDLNTLLQGYLCAKFRLNKKKLIYDSHEVQTSRTGYNSPIYGKIEGYLIKKIDSMIVENHTRAKYNEELYGFYPNVVHNYPFVQTAETSEKVPLHEMLGLPQDEKILLYQGGIQTGRGLEKLIEAAPLFNEGTLVFIGDGKIKPELERMVKERNLGDKVKFIPKVPLTELPKYTRNAYLGFQVLNNVCFNHYSASSNKLFEYMMSGIPVVACSFPEIKRVVEGERVGLCIDSHNHLEIAEAVNQLLSNEKLRDEFSRNCQQAKNKYNWDEEQQLFLPIYKAIS
jgi:glycosyltransferase involved in cell wall biosynthesis